MSASRLVLWRHGQTDWNVSGRLQGQQDIPMNDVGLDQARAAAGVLAQLPPDRIVSSDLTRAYETARFLGALTGVPVEIDRRLREIDVGEWGGRDFADIRALDPDLAEAIVRGEDIRRSPTGEKPSEVGERIAAALGDIAGTTADGRTVVVVTHGMAARIGSVFFAGGTYAETRLLGGMHNCAWITLAPAWTGSWQIKEYNVRT